MISLNSFTFLGFLLSVASLCYLTFPRFKKYRTYIVLFVSVAFIAVNSTQTLALFVIAVASVFVMAQKIQSTNMRTKKSRLLLLFGIASVIAIWLIEKLIKKETSLGLSFVSLWLVSYLIEVYWGRAQASHKLIDFAEMSTQFSYISAGPVPGVLEQQKNQREFLISDEILREAVIRIFWGLAKKSLADLILSGVLQSEVWLAKDGLVGAWIFEIFRGAWLYSDMSGYADLAIGVGLIFGYRLPENFRLPFLSYRISDYWKRWHASITHWFFQYVYMPVTLQMRFLTFRGRNNKLPASIGVFTTFLLIGLWHSLSTSQFVWAVLISLFFILDSSILKFNFKSRAGILSAWVFTQYAMAIGRMFSLEKNLASALATLERLHNPNAFYLNTQLGYWMLMSFLSVIIPHFIDSRVISKIQKREWFIWLTLSFAFILLFMNSHNAFYYEGI